ncbi:UNVERIFIED_CONTAM: hypothetical protein FKN15_066466 [Acipenser sinensis]
MCNRAELLVKSTINQDQTRDIIHKFVRDKYSKRFPELESLVPNSLDYIRTVQELGNNLDKCKNNENLQQILTNATIMVVSVTASTTQGSLMFTPLSSAGVAGGLTNLSKMPACNLMLLGAQRRSLSGFSTTSLLPHTGYIYHSDIVQALPTDLRRKAARLVSAKCTLAARVDSFHESTDGKDLRRKAARLVSAKCTLAARVDSFHESTDGKVGYDLKEEIERKFDKWQEPPPVKQVKPLPAPLDGQRKKRGGRRYRKMKERLGLTEIRKQANRMTFAEDLGFSLGQLGKSGSGRVRQAQVNEVTKARISKSLQVTSETDQSLLNPITPLTPDPNPLSNVKARTSKELQELSPSSTEP